ncbi:MAG: hypothetical protein COW55_03630 [Rhodobacteraceae bacterium CG17_big_fil_post_rev_8_21_14_2_50_65_11]|nr:MAG: hypothetical protein COW55_03630 [Rhodobacteraceae bacterium CG17_big_fil_post_rev_8_21_14_2_50_65_11]
MTCDEVNELLPFRANGTLEGEELVAVEAALAADADLRAELAVLIAIRDTMQAEEAQSPGDFGLARLLRDVEAEARGPTPLAANDNVVSLTRLRIWQVAAAVVLAVGIGFTLPQFATSPEPVAGRDAESAVGEGYSLASGGETADFTVIFSPDASEREIRALLLDAGVEIVSGPSAIGLYRLNLLDSASRNDALEILSGADIIGDIE